MTRYLDLSTPEADLFDPRTLLQAAASHRRSRLHLTHAASHIACLQTLPQAAKHEPLVGRSASQSLLHALELGRHNLTLLHTTAQG